MNDDGLGPLMSALDPPLAVVTVAAAGERAGCLVSFPRPGTSARGTTPANGTIPMLNASARPVGPGRRAAVTRAHRAHRAHPTVSPSASGAHRPERRPS